MQFSDMIEHVSKIERKRVLCSFLFDIILLGCAATWLDMMYGPAKKGKPVQCGIPIYLWHKTCIMAIGIGVCFRPLSLCIGRGSSKLTRGHLGVIKLLLVDGFLLQWLIYGNRIFYSQENDCGKHDETRFLNNLMQTFLIMGTVYMGLYLLILCTLPRLIMYYSPPADSDSENSTRQISIT